MENKTVLFSGRFDRPHIGHIIQIMRLGQKFERVIVPVLDYPDQRFPVLYRIQILQEALSMATGSYSVLSNKEHFGKITASEIGNCGFNFDVYASNNVACLKNVESLGYKVLYLDRAYDYEASDDWKIQEIKRVLR